MISNKNQSQKRKKRIRKMKWTKVEDYLLIQGVKKYGNKKWTRIAKEVKTRTNKQCRERYTNHLNPSFSKIKFWNDIEIWILFLLNKIHFKKWCKISKYMKNRSQNDCKNFWRTKMTEDKKIELEQKLSKIKKIFLNKQEQFSQIYKSHPGFDLLENYFRGGENEELIHDNKIKYEYRNEISKEKLSVEFFKSKTNIKKMIHTINKNFYTKRELIKISKFFLENFVDIVSNYKNNQNSEIKIFKNNLFENEKKYDLKILKNNFLHQSIIAEESLIQLRLTKNKKKTV